MARMLADSVAGIPGVRITRAVEASAVFAVLPGDAADAVRAQFPFYTWDEATGEVRWLCSWDTTEDDVRAFAGALREACAADAVSAA
jgi:threonine aldolase